MRKIKIGEKECALHYGQNAICALEDALDESISDIFQRLEKGNVCYKDFRALLWAGLLKEQRTLTLEQLGDMCDEAGVRISDVVPDCIEELNASFLRLVPDKAQEEKTEKN